MDLTTYYGPVMKMRNTSKRFISAAIFMLAAGAAQALQIIEPVEGSNSFAKISAKETTRLVIEGAKIKTMLATDGELTYEKDTDRGQLFIRPVVLNKPINVRLISTSGATYNLILSAVDIPQEDVIIREPFAAKMDRAGTGGSFTASQSKRSGVNPSQGKTIRDLVAVMALEEPPSTANVRAADEELALWENTRFVLTAIYQDRGLVGEKYTLTNTGKTQIRLVEQELYRKGVLAVAIENMNLAPGQSTSVYVVRAN